jgi:hypothetical protein
MKQTYFITATINPLNKVITVWTKASDIQTALNQSFTLIERDYKELLSAGTYAINGIWLGETHSL